MTLEELLEGVAADLDGVTASRGTDGGLAWSRGAAIFAALEGEAVVAAFRLEPAIAAAAVRTPDTEPSPRGQGWVSFRPATLDGHAIDRATAWFIAAYRRATRG